MAKNNKAPKKEYIPEGMSKKDYADAAFRKKVTIIMGSILLVFVIGVCAVLLNAKISTDKHNEEFAQVEQQFKEESAQIKEQLAEIEANGGEYEDKAVVEINVTDDNFSYWVGALDESYQLDYEDPDYSCYGGATIHLRGKFVKRVFAGNNVNYWVYQEHDHSHGGEHEEEESAEATDKATEKNPDTSLDVNNMIPIEVIFDEKDIEIPEDGTMVEVSGVIGVDSNNSMSAIHHAVMTVVEDAEEEHDHK